MKHTGPISGISTWAETFVATAGYDNLVILWDARSGRALQRACHDHLANQCSFSPDGRLLVSASSDYTARLWDVPSLRLRGSLAGHDDDVEMAVFAPQSDRIATCSRDHTIRIFDLDGRCLHVLTGHTADVISVSWAADGRTLVSSSDDGTVRRWSAETGRQIGTIGVAGVETDTIAVTANGVVFAGDDEGRISIIQAGRTSAISAHDAGIKRIVWSDAERLLVSLSYDRSVVVWSFDPAEGLRRRNRTALPSIVWPRSCAFLGREKLVFGTFGSRYATWNHADDAWLTDGIEPDISLNTVAVSGGSTYAIGDSGVLLQDGVPSSCLGSLCNFLLPFGPALLTGGQMGQLFEAKSGRLIHQHRSPLNCGATFVRNGELHAIIGTYTGEGLVLALRGDSAVLMSEIKLHDNAVKGLAADGRRIFSVCATAAAAFHHIDDFSLDRHVPAAHSRIANGCTCIEGGFASVGRDLKLRLWLGDTTEVHETPHANSIKCIAASPDGQTIATGSYGGTIALFDLKKRRWTDFVRPTASGISSLAANGEMPGFLASSYDGKLYSVGIG